MKRTPVPLKVLKGKGSTGIDPGNHGGQEKKRYRSTGMIGKRNSNKQPGGGGEISR